MIIYKGAEIKKFKNINIFQIGAGGTGSYTFPLLYKYICSYSKLNSKFTFRYKIIDFDIVEPKNVDRQNFLTSDIDRLKSEVLVNRYMHPNALYPNITLSYSDADICNDFILSSFLTCNAKDAFILVLGCVDNVDTRLIINETLSKMSQSDPEENYYRIIYIDSGNTINTGQLHVVKYNDSKDSENFINIFDNDETRALDEIVPTCSENGDQSIFANVRASDLLYTVASETVLHQSTGIKKIEFSRYMLNVSMDTNYQIEKGLI